MRALLDIAVFTWFADHVEPAGAEREPDVLDPAAFEAGCRTLLSDLCHRVRTPVNGILGSLELLLDRDVDPERRELLRTAYDSTRRLHDVFEQQILMMYEHLGELTTDHR